MIKLIVLDEFHLTIKVRRDLDEAASKAIARTMNSRRFQANLRRVVMGLFAQHRPLRAVRLILSR